MTALKQTLALTAWFLIWVPTSLFVLAVMFKSVWSTQRGRTLGVAGLVAAPTLILTVRTILTNGRKLA